MLKFSIFVLLIFFMNKASVASIQIPGVSSEMSDLIEKCAPRIHPETMASLISAESKGNQFDVADAGPVSMPWRDRKRLVRTLHYSSMEEAVKGATALIQNGHTVSLGLTQVNDRNLKALGITIRDAFNSCVNIAAGGNIFTAYYLQAVKQFGAGADAMRAALSAYNSGDWWRGGSDGYVDLVLNQRGKGLNLRSGYPPHSQTQRIEASAL